MYIFFVWILLSISKDSTWHKKFKLFVLFKFFTWKQKHVELFASHLSTVFNCTIGHHFFLNILHIYIHISHIHIYTYTYTVNFIYRNRMTFCFFKSYSNGIFLRQRQSIHFDLLGSYRRSLFVMLNEYAQRVKDRDV